MSDFEVSEDGTIAPADAEAVERAVTERLQRYLAAQPVQYEPVEVIEITIGFQEPLA
jgi:hypothetical protein